MANPKWDFGSQSKGNPFDRGIITFYSLLITCLALILTVEVSKTAHVDGSVESIGTAGEFSDIIQQPNYTDIYINVTYQSESNYDPNGLGGLYFIAKAYAKLILEKPIPKDLIIIEDNRIKVKPIENWSKLILQYMNILVDIVILILFIVLMPMCGCCYCIFSGCSSRSDIYDRKGNTCRRTCLGAFLIIFGILLLFFATCAYVSNARLKDGLNDLPEDLRHIVEDSETFLDTTNSEIGIVLKKNFIELNEAMDTSLDGCSNWLFVELDNAIEAISLGNIIDSAKNLTKIPHQIISEESSRKNLVAQASKLDEDLKSIASSLTNAAKDYPLVAQHCTDLAKKLNEINISIDTLPDISNETNQLDRILKQIDVTKITELDKELEDMKKKFKNTVEDNISKTKIELEKAGTTISENADEISTNIQELEDILNNFTYDGRDLNQTINLLQDNIKQFGPYQSYSGMGICLALQAITVIIFVGLIFGVFGRKAVGSQGGYCGKSCGSRFLLCGVISMFFVTSVVGIVTLLYLLFGTITQQVVCEPLRQPKDSQIFKIIDQLNLTSMGMNGKVSDVIDRCHQNQSLYRVFDIGNQFDIDQIGNYIHNYNISEVLEELNQTISQYVSNFEILTPDDFIQIEGLKKVAGVFDSDFKTFVINVNKLNDTFIQIDKKLGQIIDEVTAIIDQIGKKDERLNEVLKNLKDLRSGLIDFSHEVINYTGIILEMNETLCLGNSDITVGMSSLIDEIANAQDILQNKETKNLTDFAEEFGESMLNQTQNYLDRVINMTKYEIGRCGPLSNILNATLTSTCDKIALQMNSLWFSLLCCMLLVLPTIIISAKLSTLYEKQQPYTDDHVETTRNIHVKKRDSRSENGTETEFYDVDIAKIQF